MQGHQCLPQAEPLAVRVTAAGWMLGLNYQMSQLAPFFVSNPPTRLPPASHPPPMCLSAAPAAADFGAQLRVRHQRLRELQPVGDSAAAVAGDMAVVVRTVLGSHFGW